MKATETERSGRRQETQYKSRTPRRMKATETAVECPFWPFGEEMSRTPRRMKATETGVLQIGERVRCAVPNTAPYEGD